jgi:Spy/CpxP family protein refolding chaperone
MSIQQIRRSVLVTVAVAALAVAGLFAGRLSANAFPQGARSDFAPRMFARISHALDLTSVQQSQIKDILRSHETEIEAQMTAARTARQALRTAVTTLPVDEATIRARAADAGKVHADGAVLFAGIRAEIDPILTADQKAKLLAFQSRIGHKGDNAVQGFHNFLNNGS